MTGERVPESFFSSQLVGRAAALLLEMKAPGIVGCHEQLRLAPGLPRPLVSNSPPTLRDDALSLTGKGIEMTASAGNGRPHHVQRCMAYVPWEWSGKRFDAWSRPSLRRCAR
jgi:hypothetical protein